MLYQIAFATGYRCGELASLTTASLLLDDNPPVIVVEARDSKRGQEEIQLIPHWLVSELHLWLHTRPIAGGTMKKRTDLFPGSWAGRAAEVIRID